MARRIIHGWWTECSHCGGNSLMEGEDRHIHGGPDHGPAWAVDSQSTLSHTNGCRAAFDEPDEHRYMVWNGKQEDYSG